MRRETESKQQPLFVREQAEKERIWALVRDLPKGEAIDIRTRLTARQLSHALRPMKADMALWCQSIPDGVRVGHYMDREECEVFTLPVISFAEVLEQDPEFFDRYPDYVAGLSDDAKAELAAAIEKNCTVGIEVLESDTKKVEPIAPDAADTFKRLLHLIQRAVGGTVIIDMITLCDAFHFVGNEVTRLDRKRNPHLYKGDKNRGND